MLIATTLTPDDFKKVHNGKCKLYSLLQRLRPVAKDELVGELERAIEEIEAGLAGAYAEESRLFEDRGAMYRKLAAEHGMSHSTWSMYEIDDMKVVPYPEAKLLRYDGGWGYAQEVPLVQPASWIGLWIAADAAIKKSGDTHHTFIESLDLVDGVVVLSTGS